MSCEAETSPTCEGIMLRLMCACMLYFASSWASGQVGTRSESVHLPDGRGVYVCLLLCDVPLLRTLCRSRNDIGLQHLVCRKTPPTITIDSHWHTMSTAWLMQPYKFNPPADVLACLPPTPWCIPPEEIASRRDLRDMCIVSIDPPTARDLDDAVSLETLPDGMFRLGVHIADVSYFVRCAAFWLSKLGVHPVLLANCCYTLCNPSCPYAVTHCTFAQPALCRNSYPLQCCQHPLMPWLLPLPSLHHLPP